MKGRSQTLGTLPGERHKIGSPVMTKVSVEDGMEMGNEGKG